LLLVKNKIIKETFYVGTFAEYPSGNSSVLAGQILYTKLLGAKQDW